MNNYKGVFMRNFLIFLGILFVGYLAYSDTKARFEEVETICNQTPAQIELKTPTQKNFSSGARSKELLQNKSQPDRTNTMDQRMNQHSDKIKQNNRDSRNHIPNITSP